MGCVSVAGLVAHRFKSAGMASRRSWQACLSRAGRSLDPAAEVSVRPKREGSKERKKQLFFPSLPLPPLFFLILPKTELWPGFVLSDPLASVQDF